MKTLTLALAAFALLAPLAGAADLSIHAPPAPRTHAVIHVHMGPPGLGVPIFTLGYQPPYLEIKPGDVVEFHSHGTPFGHTATNGIDVASEPVEAVLPGGVHLNSFNTGTVVGPNSVSVTFTEPGVYPYYCAIATHRSNGMRSVIIVDAA